MKLLCSLLLLLLVSVGEATRPPAEAKVTPVEYSDSYDDDYELLGYVSVPEGANEDSPVPAIVIIPDASGVDDYEKLRATLIVEDFGWVGFAADIYGPAYQNVELGREARRNLTGTYRSDPELFFGRMQAAVDAAASHPAVDPDNIGIIGYCFGGTGVLTYSFLGGTSIKGAVSFHGGLTEFPTEENINAPVLVLSGGDDDTGTEVEVLEQQLNQANATWQITRFSNIQHAFTVWGDARGRYNERADDRSWTEMGTFLGEAFGTLEVGTTPPESTNVVEVEYDDDGFALTGYLAVPTALGSLEAGGDGKIYPGVVIVPDWDGVSGPDGYEAQRATLLADAGYIAMAADIYGSDLTQVEDFDTRVEQATLYRSDPDLFLSRMQAAVDLLKENPSVDSENILLIGYCFGGTGAVDYAFSGLTDVKAVVPFHGGLAGRYPIFDAEDDLYPYVLVQSGGEDDAHGNNTELEMALNDAGATWEITRYSGVLHGFTNWESSAYNARADLRSWEAMYEVFERVLAPTIVDLAIATDDLATLVDLVVAAGLVDALAGDGPFTVFAPTNDAFSMVPEETLAALGDDIDALTQVLLYHVVEGAVYSTDLEDGMEVTTLNGATVTISLPPPMVNDANVVMADVAAKNGVVHVIDAVLLPPEGEEEEEENLPELGGPKEVSEDELVVSRQEIFD